MSETQIEELERRASILVNTDQCVMHSEFESTAVYIDLGLLTGITIDPVAGRLRVLHHGDAFHRIEGIVTYHDEKKVEEVLKILRLRTVLEDIADV